MSCGAPVVFVFAGVFAFVGVFVGAFVFVGVCVAQVSAPCLPIHLHWIADTVWHLLLTACQQILPGAAKVGTLTLHVQVPCSCVSLRQLCCLFACSLDSWCSTVVAYGRDADRIAHELQPFRTTCLTAGSLADAVELAIELAQPGGCWHSLLICRVVAYLSTRGSQWQ